MSSNEEYPYDAPLKLGLKRGHQLKNNKTNEDFFLACDQFIQVKKVNPKLS